MCFIWIVKKDENIAKVGSINGENIVWSEDQPSPQFMDLLKKCVDEVARTTTSLNIFLEGKGRFILIHEEHKGDSFKRELIHELQYNNDYNGKSIFTNRVQGTIHALLLNAICDIKCEKRCIDEGLETTILKDLEAYSKIRASNFKNSDEEFMRKFNISKNKIIGDIITRIVGLSPINNGTIKTEVDKLYCLLKEIGKCTFRQDILNLKKVDIQSIRNAIVTKCDGTSNEDPTAICTSVNNVVKLFSETSATLKFDEQKAEFYLEGGEKNMDESEKIDYFRKLYMALKVLGSVKPEVATPAIASLRLLLVDAVGEEKQKELIGQWNEEE